MTSSFDADSATARVSHEFADLPGDDGESQSLRRRRFAEGAPRAASSTRRNVLLKRFFTWLSVLRTNEAMTHDADGCLVVSAECGRRSTHRGREAATKNSREQSSTDSSFRKGRVLVKKRIRPTCEKARPKSGPEFFPARTIGLTLERGLEETRDCRASDAVNAKTTVQRGVTRGPTAFSRVVCLSLCGVL